MKTPKAKKLKSGNWRVQMMVDGTRRSFTAPTKQEAETEAMRWKVSSETPALGTLGQAMMSYIESRESVLSPSTTRRYRKIVQLNFLNLQKRVIASISDKEFQQEINSMSKSYSSKTIKNVWAFMCSVLRESGRDVKVSLPQVISEPHSFLQPEQIKPFLAELEGETLEIPILLALHGLRRSEIMDIEWKDIDLKNNVIQVSGSAVIGMDGLVHKKENKNSSSRRTVPILIPRLRTLLESSDRTNRYVCDCNPNSIYNAVNRVCDRLGYPHIGVHGCRHTFVSLCFHEGINELACMKLGGFADFATMRRIYTHLANSDMDTAKTQLSNFFALDSHTDT